MGAWALIYPESPWVFLELSRPLKWPLSRLWVRLLLHCCSFTLAVVLSVVVVVGASASSVAPRFFLIFLQSQGQISFLTRRYAWHAMSTTMITSPTTLTFLKILLFIVLLILKLILMLNFSCCFLFKNKVSRQTPSSDAIRSFSVLPFPKSASPITLVLEMMTESQRHGLEFPMTLFASVLHAQ